jgi:dihydropteroate synthase
MMKNMNSDSAFRIPHSPLKWSLKTQTLHLDAGPAIMGIVNVTPDSFSDGGKYDSTELAIEHAVRLIEDGADIIDIGGESTRPYSEPVDQREEQNRVVPVIEGLVERMKDAAVRTVPISIDTSKAAVAKAAIEAGAEIINDVTGLEGDPKMLQVATESKVGVCAMHMQGTPQNMQDHPKYDNVVEDVYGYLAERKKRLLDAGIDEGSICLDPGIGFGKTHEHNIQLLRHVSRFVELGCPILVGHSRKGFIGQLLGDKEADRDSATLAIALMLAQQGVHVIRVHEVKNTVAALKVMKKLSA